MTQITGGASTYSRQQSRRSTNAPKYSVGAQGCYVFGDNGAKLIDYPMALAGPIFGYNPSFITEALHKSFSNKMVTSFAPVIEKDVAELIGKICPDIEQVRFAKNGSDVCSAAVRLARAVTGRDKIASCYDDQTEILTKDGFKYFKDVIIGELVATLNPETKHLEYQPALETMAFPYVGDMISFVGNRVNLLVTPEHNIYRGYGQANRKFRFELDRADKSFRRQYTRMTTNSVWIGESPEIYTIPPATSICGNTKGITEFRIEPFLRFMGWYITEGCVPLNGGNYCISLSQNNGDIADKMIATIRELGFSPCRTAQHIAFNSKELALYLRPLGHASDKYVPCWIKGLSTRLLRIFLDALIDGDGTREKNGRERFYTSSKRLANDVQEIGLKLNLSAYVAERKNTGFSKNNLIYHVYFCNRVIVRSNKPVRLAYDGTIYCVRTENGIVLIRRKGRCVWSGNSGYHGFGNEFAEHKPSGGPHTFGVVTEQDRGVPKCSMDLLHTFAWGDKQAMRDAAKDAACVIIEIPPTDDEISTTEFIEACKIGAHANGALFILDEVVTGFRFALGGATEYYASVDIRPDLYCFGKAMANGYPVSAIGGRSELMEEFQHGVFFSMTFADDPLGLAVAEATLRKLIAEKDTVYSHLWYAGGMLKDGINQRAAEYGISVKCVGQNPRTVLEWTDESLRTRFMEECIGRGVLFDRPQFITKTHTADIVQRSLETVEDTFEEMVNDPQD